MKKKLYPKLIEYNSSSWTTKIINRNEGLIPNTNIENKIHNDLPYDPNTCMKKKFEDFIPKMILDFPSNMDSKHAIDFYLENRPFLIIYESSATIMPSNMKETYSSFSSWSANIKYKDTLHTNKDAELLVNYYENENGDKYVIKKCWHYFDIDLINSHTIYGMETFIRSKFNEYSIMKITNGSPNSVQPIQFHIIHLPKIKYIVTELLMPFGGNPLTEYVQKLTPEEIYEIVNQMTNTLDYLDSYNIEHNDIKAGNILVDSILNKRIIRLIDLDIGRNISITNKSSIRNELAGFTAVYCSPEIYQITQDPKHLRTFSSRKGQIYSLGVLLLFLCRFFPNDMNSNEFDAYKKDESIYKQFLNIFIESTNNIADPLKRKLLKIAEICLSFNPENRLLAKELKEILKNLESKDIQEISNQHTSILFLRIRNFNNTKTITWAEHENLINKIKVDFNHTIQEEQKSKNKLVVDNLYLANELKVKQEEIEKLKFEESNLRILLRKSNEEVDKLQRDLTEKLILYEEEIGAVKKGLEGKLYNQIVEKNELLDQIQCLKKTNEILIGKNTENEEIIKEYLDKIEQVGRSEKIFLENISEYQILKKKFSEKALTSFFNSKAFHQLIMKLFEAILKLKIDAIKCLNVRYVDGLQFTENSIYFGTINQENKPHGTGIVLYQEPYRKFIGEFENGQIKNDLGILISENESYYFGKIKNGICENISFMLPKFPNNLGNFYYFGETKQNVPSGKGKFELVNNQYYEGEWMKGLKDGKGKKYTLKSGQVEQIEEGVWVKGEQKGKFTITNSMNQTSFAYY